MRRKNIFILLLAVLLLIGCNEETGEKKEEPTGVYYQALSERDIKGVYDVNASYIYSTLKYDDKMYTSIERYKASDKAELNIDAIMGEELKTVYGSHGVWWSTNAEELLEVTDEVKLYSVKGYDESFRVCVYYEEYIKPLKTTFYNLFVFECVDDIYLNKGSELFRERVDLSKSVKVTTASDAYAEEIELSMEAEDICGFLDALCEGTFVDSKDENYPKLADVCSCTMRFFDERGLVTTMTVYENGYVSTKTAGQSFMVIQVDQEKCQKLVWSWAGIYRTTVTTNIYDNSTEELEIKLAVEESDKRNINVYVKEVVKLHNSAWSETTSIRLNNSVEGDLDIRDNIIFSMKASLYTEEEYYVYVELKRVNGDIIYFRYADTEEELEGKDFIVLARSSY